MRSAASVPPLPGRPAWVPQAQGARPGPLASGPVAAPWAPWLPELRQPDEAVLVPAATADEPAALQPARAARPVAESRATTPQPVVRPAASADGRKRVEYRGAAVRAIREGAARLVSRRAAASAIPPPLVQLRQERWEPRAAEEMRGVAAPSARPPLVPALGVRREQRVPDARERAAAAQRASLAPRPVSPPASQSPASARSRSSWVPVSVHPA